MTPNSTNDDGEALIDVVADTRTETLTLSSGEPQSIYGIVFTASNITSTSFEITIRCCPPESS